MQFKRNLSCKKWARKLNAHFSQRYCCSYVYSCLSSACQLVYHISTLEKKLWWHISFSSTCLCYYGKHPTAAAVQRCSVKKVILEISQNSQEHNCASVSFSIKLQDCNFIKKETLAHVFSCEFYEISKNSFFTEHLRLLLLMLITIIRFGRYHILLASNCTFMSDSHYWGTIQIWQNLPILFNFN